MAEVFTRIGVVGAGAMGRGIAQVAALSGADVALTDISQEAAEAGKAAISKSVGRAVEKGKLAADEAEAALGRIGSSADLADHADRQLVIEAAVERLDAKAAIFRELHAGAPGAVLASNTSSLGIGQIAEAAGAPVIGLHFFNPAHVMPLVEVILPNGIAAPTERIMATLEGWGKTAIPAPDRPGFIVNRVARPFYGEALAMVEEGEDPAAIDASLTGAGYRLGPFALIDLVGADVNLAASETVWEAMGRHPRYHVFEALRRQVADGALGRKSERGFVTPAPAEALPLSGAAKRIEATLVNEAAYLLDEGGTSADGIDTAMKLGLSFPRGPFEIARAAGPIEIRDRLVALADKAPAHLKGRYDPAPALLAMETT